MGVKVDGQGFNSSNLSELVPRRRKAAPASPRSGFGVSAALRSRDAGEGRASLGDPGCCLGAGAPCGVRRSPPRIGLELALRAPEYPRKS